MKTKHVLLQLSGYSAHQRLAGIAEFARDHRWVVAIEDRTSLPSGWTGDGVVLNLRMSNRRLAAFARRLAERGIPAVDISVFYPEVKVPRVVGDHEAIGALAADHFAERRFRHAAFFAKNWTDVEKLRLAGFRRRWAWEPPLELVWRREVPARRHGDWQALHAWLAGRLAAAPRPLGVFAYNDMDASRVLRAALAAGLSVPEEIAILGVDDEKVVVENQPVPLSSIRHDHRRVGWEAAALLDRLMEGGSPPERPVLVPPLGIATRRSTDVMATGTPFMRRAMALVGERLADAYGVKELAADLGVSRATLCRRFEAELESTPTAEFLRQRVAKAKTLLSTTDEPLKAVAAQCGFSHASHLVDAFRAATGATPGAWRKRGAAPPGAQRDAAAAASR